jgi:S-adenosylmethionine uptake transporter
MSQTYPNPLVPFSVACIGIGTYALMDVLMKGLSIELGVYNAMLWRTSGGLVIAFVLFIWKRPAWPPLSVIRVHVWRGMVTSVMAFLFFWGLVYVPVAEAIGLSFIAPLIALYLAAVLLKEKISDKAVLASLFGLLGAVVIVFGKLSGEYDDNVGLGIGAILLSALIYAYNLILQRQQALIAGPVEIAFFQNATVVMLYTLFAPHWAVVPSAEVLPELLTAAVLGITSLMLLSWAYARAQARILIPVEYTAFLWAAWMGWLVFDEEVTGWTLVGTCLIVAGCLVAARASGGRVDHVETTAI